LAISNSKKAKIKVDFESGRFKKVELSKKWRISRTTLNKLEKAGGWVFGKNERQLDEKIIKKATSRIIDKESAKLFDYTSRHLDELNNIRTISKLNAQAIARELRDSGNNISKTEAERIFSAQKVCKIMAETLSLIYRDERLAMGADDKGKTNEDVETRIKTRMEKLKNAY